MKKLVEDAYIVGMTMASIFVWVGLEEIITKLGHHNLNHGYAFSIGSFVLLSSFGVSQSLVGKGVEFDGAMPGGEGVLVFPGKYFQSVDIGG